MIKAIQISLLILFYHIGNAQIINDSKRNNLWLFGDNWLDFSSNDTIKITPIAPIAYKIGTTASSLCDTVGNLLFYTNGCHLWNANNQIIAGTAGFNAQPNTYSTYCDSYDAGIYKGNVVSLPEPTNDSIFHLFHLPEKVIQDQNGWNTTRFNLLQQTILIRTNGHLQRKFLNKTVYQTPANTYLEPNVMAIRHGNGQDWWLITTQLNVQNFYSFLLQPNLMSSTPIISSGQTITDNYKNIYYNNEGNQIIVSTRNQVFIFPFDRCTGQVGAAKILELRDNIQSVSAISTTNHWIYVAAYSHILRFDATQNTFAKPQIVAEKDGNCLNSHFYYPFFTPNGQLIITHYEGYLDLIKNPEDSVPVFQSLRYRLSNYPAFEVPIYPNFKLGALPNNPCGVVISTPEINPNETLQNIWVYPNPVNDEGFMLKMPKANQNSSLQIYNYQSQKTQNIPIKKGESELFIPTNEFPSGVYFINLEGTTLSTKFIVL
jgi:hypothetical protein